MATQKGDHWFVENLTDRQDIVITIGSPKERVFISKLTGSVVTIKGKVNAVAIENTKTSGIIVEDDVISSVEATNCSKLQIQTNGAIPVFQIEKTHGATVFLNGEASRNASVITSLSTEVNVVVPGATEEDDAIEMAVPEQFASVYKDGKLITTPTSHV
eukprot:TRINITY_DN2777_c0_g1_i1.p2 TRINITY_DN2777_c0_g1~~TRINITY_DN2777_c0_g1_i1.p2  ORF type:complete len:172 (+),score=50.58 TRINITY_DN2777_c0_g1_i1:41-517(+)